MTNQDFNSLSDEEKLDVCREATFLKTIGELGLKIHFYRLADGHVCKMVVRDPEEELLSITLCENQELKQFNISR